MSTEITFLVPTSNNTQVLAATTGSAVESGTLNCGFAIVDPDVDVYVVQGTAATENGLRLLAGNQYRLGGIALGGKLSFRAATESGNVRVTPQA